VLLFRVTWVGEMAHRNLKKSPSSETVKAQLDTVLRVRPYLRI